VRDRKAGETTLIDPGVTGRNVEFIRATPDGHQGYFLTASQLDSASDHNAGVDLYRWDQTSKESICLTCVVSDASIAAGAGGSGSVSPVMVSDDFSHVYFVSHQRLVAHEGVRDKENLYVLNAGAIRLVATPSQQELITEALSRGNARLSSDGGALIFTSSRGGRPRLTTDAIDCGNCAQLYRYEDGESSVECLSCATSAPTTAALGAGGGVGLKGVFEMSGDGSTVGFVTPQSLAQADVNGTADVYQWRNGVKRLVTDGIGEAQEGVAAPGVRGIDADGSNMLFSVADPGLTGFELDGLANLYDARIGGGFEPPSRPVHCVEDDCQGPLVPPPAAPGAASAVGGRGNSAAPARCGHKKGKARKRCLSRHKATGQRKGHSHKPRGHREAGGVK
jgi:LSD1 subclass zinc finger protein